MGKRIALSNGRRLVDDVIRMANQTPLAGLNYGKATLRFLGHIFTSTTIRFA